jgi:hypothetical protein
MLKTCSEASRLQREATTWEHDAIHVTSQMNPRRHGKRNDTKKGKRNEKRTFCKRESNVYKPEFTLWNKPVTSSCSCSPLVSLFFLLVGKARWNIEQNKLFRIFIPHQFLTFCHPFLYLLPSFLRTVNSVICLLLWRQFRTHNCYLSKYVETTDFHRKRVIMTLGYI